MSRHFSYRATAEVCARTHVTLHDGHEAVIRWWARYCYHDRIYGRDARRGTIVQRVVSR